MWRVVRCRALATAVNSMSITVLVLAFLAQASATPTAQAPSDAPASLSVVARDAVSGAPLEGVAITVATAQPPPRVFKASTFANGTVQFIGLTPGRYDVVASAPDLLPAGSPRVIGDSRQPVTLKGGETVVLFGSAPVIGELRRPVTLKGGENPVVLFTFRKPAVIRGQVLSPEGKPVRGATVEVVTTKSQFHGRPVVAAGTGSSTDTEGRFRIEKLVPGRYLVRARLPAPADAPLNFVYVPLTTTASEATPVVLESGDEVAIGITALAVPAVPVGGRVVDTVGDPVEGATITLTSLDEATAPPAYFGPGGLHRPAGINTPESVRTDGAGRFVVRGVRQGRYALQAVIRGTGLGTPVVAAGVAEVDVRTSKIDSLTVKLLPCARITGRFLFNGLEMPDPDRSVVEMQPDGEDAHLRKGLAATTTNWLADGTFVIDGLLGRHRLTVRSSGNWFTRSAALENGTDILNGPVDLEPGKTYGNVRVWLSDEAAEIEGVLPDDWNANAHQMIMAFPEDMSLWQASRGYVRTGTVDAQSRRFSVKRIAPGHLYLIAVYSLIDLDDAEARSRDMMEVLNELWPRATRIFIGEAGKFEVTLPPPPRDR
jgi:protocatechuate 3,4-dioxygenase beta subunit